jgi:putative spermidine/putrescine transport system substrate-binding protein
MKPLLALVLLALGTAQAHAQPTLYLASYGGSSEKIFREVVIPAFEQKSGAKVEYVAGTSATNLARLQAERAKPEIDVAMLDDGPMQQAVSLNLCQPVKPSPEYDALYPIARFPNGKAVGVGVVATGLAYNTVEFAARGWPAPKSWLDLADPKYKGTLLVPTISNSYGTHALLMLARAGGGSEKQPDAGFATMEKLAPNVASFEAASAKMSELFQTKAVTLGVWGNGRVQALADAGFPVAFVYPKEGAVALFTSACVVSGSDVPDLAQSFLQHLMSADVQATLAKGAGWGPTNSKTDLKPWVASRVVYGPAAVAKLVAPDLEVINDQKQDWAKRWSRRIER